MPDQSSRSATCLLLSMDATHPLQEGGRFIPPDAAVEVKVPELLPYYLTVK